MADIPSIVIAVISLVGTLLIGLLNFGYNWSSDQRKRNEETQKLVAKYRDPLMLAAHDLQSKTWSITDGGVATHILSAGAREQANMRVYPAFLVGQYLSWVFILRRQVQFLKFSTNEKNNQLTDKLAQITEAFAGSSGHLAWKREEPFRLYRSQQMAIGEILTVKEGDELYCMGYAEFKKALGADADNVNPSIDLWFSELIKGIVEVAELRANWLLHQGPYPKIPDQRMRCLQHLLIDLIEILNPGRSGIDPNSKNRCHRSKDCCCRTCEGNLVCPSPDNKRIPCTFSHAH